MKNFWNASHDRRAMIPEYEFRRNLTFHPNIVQMLANFSCRPTKKLLDVYQKETNAVTYFLYEEDECTPKKTFVMLLERCKWTLDEYLKEPTVTLKERLRICIDVGNVLLWLQKQNMVHLDIKLDNILLREDNSILDTLESLDENQCCYVGDGDRAGGNLLFLAPEIMQANAKVPQLIDYSKQPSYELGMTILQVVYGISKYEELEQCSRYPRKRLKKLTQKLLEVDFNKRVPLTPALSELKRLYKEYCGCVYDGYISRPEENLFAVTGIIDDFVISCAPLVCQLDRTISVGDTPLVNEYSVSRSSTFGKRVITWEVFAGQKDSVVVTKAGSGQLDISCTSLDTAGTLKVSYNFPKPIDLIQMGTMLYLQLQSKTPVDLTIEVYSGDGGVGQFTLSIPSSDEVKRCEIDLCCFCGSPTFTMVQNIVISLCTYNQMQLIIEEFGVIME
eukprot:CAMPEP_0206198214 /NCGR_PEP_ID=MMETSP0166-20121206/9501_1 /ASSEMBLY_ACC=CAM_ASM_000260 /TAXON_ID=95228 /ORGANISM="Vannella robusta, Strain DIVA3 518/3/11/1/6" /LENGTH=446 /DNA_ID=CAMNT_0053616019 /DNA_START=150 /DNA_END=1489 /DNA_ORIENTATION=+